MKKADTVVIARFYSQVKNGSITCKANVSFFIAFFNDQKSYSGSLLLTLAVFQRLKNAKMDLYVLSLVIKSFKNHQETYTQP